MSTLSLEERIVRVETAFEYLATESSVMEVRGKIEATDRVVERMQWELHAILALCTIILASIIGSSIALIWRLG